MSEHTDRYASCQEVQDDAVTAVNDILREVLGHRATRDDLLDAVAACVANAYSVGFHYALSSQKDTHSE